MADKKTFIFYLEWGDVFSSLDNDSKSELLDAVLDYAQGKEVEISNPILKPVFILFKKRMDEDSDKYEKTCQARANAGKKGGSASCKYEHTSEKTSNQTEVKEANANFDKQSEAKEANANFDKQNKQKTPDNDCDNDCDCDFKREEVVKSTTATLSKSIQKITEEWNRLSPLGIKAISKVGRDTQRERQLHARLKQYSEEEILKAISNIRASPFLHGKNRQGWMITFDWFIKPNNFPKVLEGNYKDEFMPQKQSSFPERNYTLSNLDELERKLLKG